MCVKKKKSPHTHRTLWINGKDLKGQSIVYIKPGGVNPNSVETRVNYLILKVSFLYFSIVF